MKNSETILMETQWKKVAIARMDELCPHPERRTPGLGATACRFCKTWFVDDEYFARLEEDRKRKFAKRKPIAAADAVPSLIDEVS